MYPKLHTKSNDFKGGSLQGSFFFYLFIYFSILVQRGFIMFLLPLAHFTEDWSLMFTNVRVGAYPQIRVDDNTILDSLVKMALGKRFDVIVDGSVVGGSNDLNEAVSIWFSAFYVFGLRYPEKLKKFLTFIQKCILGIHDNSRKISEVISLIASLNNLAA